MPEETPSQKRKDEVAKWQGRVKVARLYQEEHGNQPAQQTNGKRRWDQNVNALAGDFNSRAELGDEAIDVNVVRASVKTKLPPLKLVQPKITVNPTVREYKGQNNIINAEKVTTEINYWFRELDIRRQVGKVLTDSVSTNCAYLYLGMVDKKEDAFDTKDRTEMRPDVRHKQPFVKRHSPKMVLVPPGKWDLEECAWVDIVFNVPLEQVAEKFGIDKEDIPTTDRVDLNFDNKNTQMAAYMDSDDVKTVEVHNIWDKESKKVRIFAKDMEDYLEEPKDWPWEVEGFPLVHYRPEEISDQYYGTPPTTYIMPQQKELNAARTALRKRFNRSKATIIITDDVDQGFEENYKKAQDGEVLRTKMEGDDLKKSMIIDQGLPLDGVSLTYGQLVKADIIEIDGQSSEQRGSGDPNVDSATASANIQRNANIRGSESADGVRTMYLTVARKLWMMIANAPNVSVVRRVEGPIAGVFSEVKYSTKELRGEFQFAMEFSAKIPDTDQEKMQKAMLRYNLFRQDPLINPKELILDVYISQGEINPESKLQFLRSPDEEHQMFMQGLHAEPHERDDHQAHHDAHDAFVTQLDEMQEQIGQELASQPTLEDGAGDPRMDKVRTAQMLLTTHLNATLQKIQQIAGPGAANQPVSENVARAGIKSVGNAETEAELQGNPLGPVN